MAARHPETLIPGISRNSHINGNALVEREHSSPPERKSIVVPDPLDASFKTLGIDKTEFENSKSARGLIIGEAYLNFFQRAGSFEERNLGYLAQAVIRKRYGDMVNTSFQAAPTDYVDRKAFAKDLQEGKITSLTQISMTLTPAQAILRQEIEDAFNSGTVERKFWDVFASMEESFPKITPVREIRRSRDEAKVIQTPVQPQRV